MNRVEIINDNYPKTSAKRLVESSTTTKISAFKDHVKIYTRDHCIKLPAITIIAANKALQAKEND